MRVHGGASPIVLSAAEAVRLVPDGATLVIEGSGGGVVEPSALINALGERYLDTGSPKDLTLMFASGLGDRAGAGADHLAHPGLLRRTILGHYGMSPWLAERAQNGEFEAYNLPQGVIVQLLREIAGNRPGLITKTGLGTFIDPRLQGGRLNDATVDDVVEVITIDGEEWLRYLPRPIDAVFIRGTTADQKGNLTLEREAARLAITSAAMAARNSGGIVIAQVQRIAAAGSLNARDVVVPGHLIDYLVVAPDQWQTAESQYNPSYSGEVRVPLEVLPPQELDERIIIGRRAFAEIRSGSTVNLGVGMPDAVAAVANEFGALNDMTLTVEQGLSGGMPARGVVFGVVWNPESILDQGLQFDFYDGGGLDITCLGFAQVDRFGNVNSSQLAGRVFGVGGFVNISQATPRVVLCGTMTSGGLQLAIGNGKISIVSEGRHRKFVNDVSQISFSGPRSLESDQEVLLVTERAVFELTQAGWKLIEIAPGIDVERDVLAVMDFEPIVPTSIPLMDPALFNEQGAES